MIYPKAYKHKAFWQQKSVSIRRPLMA